MFSLRMVKFLHLIVQEFKWFELFWVEKIENSNRIFGRFLGSWWLFFVNYSKLSECSLHDMYWEFDRNLKKRSTQGLFAWSYILSDLRNNHLTEFFRDTIYLSKVTKHFPPWRVKRCENDVCLYHKERIKRFQMDSVNYEQLISPFIWRILSVLDERNYTCLFRYPGISYGINILHLWILKAEDCVGTDFTHSPLFFPFLTTSITSVHLDLLGASLI